MTMALHLLGLLLFLAWMVYVAWLNVQTAPAIKDEIAYLNTLENKEQYARFYGTMMELQYIYRVNFVTAGGVLILLAYGVYHLVR